MRPPQPDGRGGAATDLLVPGPLPAAANNLPDEPDAAAADLADLIVHRLFEIGLVIQTAAAAGDHPARQRLHEAAAELDDVIRDVRSVAFGAAR